MPCRYLDTMEDSAELKAKILDWKPEVFETKTRRQSNQVKGKAGGLIREIFGIDLKTARESKRKMMKRKELAAASASMAASEAASLISPPTPSPAKSDVSSIPSTSSPSKSRDPIQWNYLAQKIINGFIKLWLEFLQIF